MTIGVILIVSMLILGGVLATLGDRIGTKVGKARLSLFNLRPKKTATVVTILTGITISASTLGILFGTSKPLRKGIFEYDQIQERLREIRKELEQARIEKSQVQAELNNTQSQLGGEQERLQATQQRLDAINRSLQAAIARQAETEAELSRTQRQLKTEIAQLQKEREQLIQERDRVMTQITQRDQQIEQQKREITQQETEITQQETELNQKRQAIVQQETALAEQKREITRQEQEISAQEQAIAEQESAIAEKEQQIARQESTIAEQNQAIDQQKQEIAQREARLTELEQLREEAIAQRDRATAERETLIQELSELQNQQAFLQRAVQILQENVQGFEQGVVVLQRNQVLATGVVRIVEPRAAQEAVRQLLLEANRAAIRIVQPGTNNSDQPIIQITQAEVEQLVRQIDDGQDYVLRILSAANYLLGQPQIQVFADAALNRIVFLSGEVVAATSVDPKLMNEAQIQERIDLLLAASSFRARREGILADRIEIADGNLAALVRFIERVQQYDQAVEVQAIAAENTYTSGPLKMDLVAVQNGEVIFRML